MMTNNTYNKIEVLIAFLAGSQIIDDHNGSIILKECMLGELIGDNKELVLIINGVRYQSLNAVYLRSDGFLHLSRMSVAGTLTGSDFEDYNESCTFDSFKIKRVISRNGKEMFNINDIENKSSNLETLLTEISELCKPDKDSKLLELREILQNIRNKIKDNSKSFTITTKMISICNEADNFDEIKHVIPSVVNSISADLMDNDILLNKHDPEVGFCLTQIEVKFI